MSEKGSGENEEKVTSAQMTVSTSSKSEASQLLSTPTEPTVVNMQKSPNSFLKEVKLLRDVRKENKTARREVGKSFELTSTPEMTEAKQRMEDAMKRNEKKEELTARKQLIFPKKKKAVGQKRPTKKVEKNLTPAVIENFSTETG